MNGLEFSCFADFSVCIFETRVEYGFQERHLNTFIIHNSLVYVLFYQTIFSKFFNALKGQCHKIFASGFFHEPVCPKPLIIPIRTFQIFSKICGDIPSSRCTTGFSI
jgi:hypothetical protein